MFCFVLGENATDSAFNQNYDSLEAWTKRTKRMTEINKINTNRGAKRATDIIKSSSNSSLLQTVTQGIKV